MNIKVDFDNIVVKEDKNDFNVKVLMLKGEKGDAGSGEANVIETVQVNGTALPVTNKTVNVSVPTVDSTISSSSTNPVQNKVIYNALGNKVDTSELDNYYEISEVDYLLSGKVDTSVLNDYYTKEQTYSKNETDLLLEDKADASEIDTINSTLLTKANISDVANTYETIASHNADINALTSQITSLASGSPLVASSTSEMTDTTKVYVNTSDGNWYYYNGSSWVVGGVYQSTGLDNDDLAIDGRNTLTSNLALYDGYKELKPIGEVYSFEYGDLSGSVGDVITFSTQQWRKRTSSPIVLGIGEDIEILNMSNGYVSTRLFTCGTDDKIISAGGWMQSNFYLHGRTDRRYYLLIQITGHYNWDVTTEELSKIRIRYNQISRQNYLHNLFDVNVYPFATDRSITYDASNRCITDYFNYDGKVKIKGDYQWIILQFNKSTKEYIKDETSWMDTGYFTFNPNYLYKIMFRKSDNSNLTVNEILNNMRIYPIEQTDASITYNFPNIILNNHQGYSNQYTTGMNLASSYYNSFLQGYKYAECDVRFTLDNVPVCCHDASFTDGGITVVIAETNYEDLIEYDYYDGNHISSLDEIMSNCKKYGLTLQIDQLSSVWTETQWTNLFKVIDKYQMKDYVMYSAGNQTIISKVLSFDSKARCIINITDINNIQSDITTAHNNKNGKNKFILAINHNLITPEQVATLNQTLEEDIYVGVWTIDNLTTLLSYIPYAYMITTNKITPSEIINSFM